MGPSGIQLVMPTRGSAGEILQATWDVIASAAIALGQIVVLVCDGSAQTAHRW